jgi:hypothetical protein
MSSRDRRFTLAGTSPVRRSPRVAVTVTASVTAAGATTISTFSRPAPGAIVCRASAKPAARTMIATSVAVGTLAVKRPSGPVSVCWSRPEMRTMTAAPDTTPPALSRTVPVTTSVAGAAA